MEIIRMRIVRTGRQRNRGRWNLTENNNRSNSARNNSRISSAKNRTKSSSPSSSHSSNHSSRRRSRKKQSRRKKRKRKSKSKSRVRIILQNSSAAHHKHGPARSACLSAGAPFFIAASLGISSAARRE